MPNTDGQATRKQSIPKHLNASLPGQEKPGKPALWEWNMSPLRFILARRKICTEQKRIKSSSLSMLKSGLAQVRHKCLGWCVPVQGPCSEKQVPATCCWLWGPESIFSQILLAEAAEDFVLLSSLGKASSQGGLCEVLLCLLVECDMRNRSPPDPSNSSIHCTVVCNSQGCVPRLRWSLPALWITPLAHGMDSFTPKKSVVWGGLVS